jgi:mannan endo-1,4-beta-mannosidase
VPGRRPPLLAAASLAALLACDPAPPPPSPAALERAGAACDAFPPRPFAGEPGTIVALNAYYLQEEATRALRAGHEGSDVLEEVLGEAAAMGARAVRTNAFNDDPAKAGDSAIQVAPLLYDETALRGLDLVLARAHAHGVRLVLPLGNYWDAYGGARQYVAWAGLPEPRSGDARFFTDRRVVDHYRAHVTALLSRVNTIDGIRYGDHPAVLAWELLNEAYGGGLRDGGAALRAWVDELGALVHALAPGHLVGTGEVGFETAGASFARNTASPSIDVASVHLYPDAWGVAPEDIAAFGASWISAHARVAAAAGKPLLLGELGLRGDGALDLPRRRAVYRGWLACARTAGLAGAAPWLFANDARPAAWDPYSFAWHDGTASDDPENAYVDVLEEAAAAAELTAVRAAAPP